VACRSTICGSVLDGKSKYKELASFAVGLASIPPGTHTVEGDFSTLKGIKDPSRSSLSNYALEGQLHAKQFFDVTTSVAELGRDGDLVTPKAVVCELVALQRYEGYA
jgi:hypothetical protein